MLLFKQKFHDAIRSGKKTQTLRSWKTQRVKAGQKEIIPGVGPIMIDSVEKVLLNELTDADAIPDGFPTVEALTNELHEIYGDELGNLYKIRFHILKDTPGESEISDQGPSEKSSETDQSAASADSSNPTDSGSKRKSIPPELLVPQSKESPAVVKFVVAMKREFAERMEKYKDQLEYKEYLKIQQIENEARNLSETGVVRLMIRRCHINRNVCDWNHEPCKSQDFFDIFLRSPRNERGVPILDGYRLRSLMRDCCDEEEWESISWIATEICSAWTEWQYAVEHWMNQLTSPKQE